MSHLRTAALSVLALTAVLSASRPAAAERSVLYGVGVSGGAAFPLMNKRIRGITHNGDHIGFIVRRVLSPNWQAAVSVERLKFQRVDVTPLLLSGIYLFAPNAVVTPVARLGLGVARVHGVGSATDMDERLALKPGAGVEASLARNLTAGFYADFLWSPPADRYQQNFGSLTVGPQLTYFFGARPARAARAAADVPEEAAEESAEEAKVLAAGKEVKITLNVEFETGKAAVKKRHRRRIRKVADFMQKYAGTEAVIAGHTDNVGDTDFNRKLSRRRAESVMNYLIDEFDIDESRLSAVGYGPDEPISSNETPAGRRQNRRVVATLRAVED